MEVSNHLLNYKNLKIIQNSNWFKFSLDSILLPNFITLNKNVKKILDLGTGNAPIPLILSTKTEAMIYGVEIQKEIYDLAIKNVEINELGKQIEIINADIKSIDKIFDTDTFDIIVSNPPYFKIEEDSFLNANEIKTIARHEVLINVEQIISMAKKLLKNNGFLALVHRSDRLIEIIELMRKYNIEPKKIRFVYPKVNKESNIILIEGTKNGKSGIKIMPPLFVHNKDGSYTEEIQSMFE
jgi:tRNA1(Val) A37 N6-methylase TrmN6